MIDALAAMQIHGNAGDLAHLFLLVAVIVAAQFAASR